MHRQCDSHILARVATGMGSVTYTDVGAVARRTLVARVRTAKVSAAAGDQKETCASVQSANVRSAVLGQHDQPELSPGLSHDAGRRFRLPVAAAAAVGLGQPAA